MTSCEVLIFTEDPGAANFLAPLPQELQNLNLSSTLIATGLSVSHLRTRNAEFVDISSTTDNAQQIIDRYNPKVIVAGTAENKKTRAFELFGEARRRQIPSVGVVDMIVNADCRFRGEGDQPFAHAPDYIMVPDDETHLAFTSLGFPSDKLAVTGYPQFDFIRQQASPAMPLPGSRRPTTIVFVAEPESKLNPALSTRNSNYGFHGRGISNFRTHIVLEELLAALRETEIPCRKVVRLHPKNTLEEFENYRDEIDEFSQGGDPLSSFRKADLVVGITSMALQEAAWLGKRTLSVLPEISDRQRLAAISVGLIPAVFSYPELVESLLKFKQNDWPQLHPETYFKLGACKTMASFIDRLCGEQSVERA